MKKKNSPKRGSASARAHLKKKAGLALIKSGGKILIINEGESPKKEKKEGTDSTGPKRGSSLNLSIKLRGEE